MQDKIAENFPDYRVINLGDVLLLKNSGDHFLIDITYEQTAPQLRVRRRYGSPVEIELERSDAIEAIAVMIALGHLS